jgi:hypothetical protein
MATFGRERDDADHISRSSVRPISVTSASAGCRQDVANDTMELNAMSSPEELTFVVGRWLRPIVVVLDVVRRFNLRTTSSREHRRTNQNQ